ncbi:MAG: NAD-dependent epimerase/dehydratase family protein [Planctomycetota bacterium]|nr:MAG: NAD-dependent epimerase/dehydratase family protein [Planctomycetota bacterium]
MQIVITGADGFVGRNLRLRLAEIGHHAVTSIVRGSTAAELATAIAGADLVVHLAGVNRPQDPAEFAAGNAGFTTALCRLLEASGRQVPVIFSSSTQAALDNPYGRSKLAAEEALLSYATATASPVHIFRLTNVFGKWSRPNYNSAVATFCHNIARGLPIAVSDPAAPLRLVYVDDVIDAFLGVLAQGGEGTATGGGFCEAGPVYATTVGEVADSIRAFAGARETLLIPPVGTGLARALHATYVSFLPPASFAYQVPRHIDPRGEFVEMLRTSDSGQFSYFTAHPGITRGGHYHHSKTEKFLVIRGTARFGFRHVESGEVCDLTVRGGEGSVVETAPGWAHDVTNVGDDELLVMLWANELFDRNRPDTIAMKVDG